MAELTAAYLEEIISDSKIDRKKLVEALIKPLVRPSQSDFFSERYLKYDLADTINQELSDGNFGVQDFYGALNKEPMKRVGYGLLNSKEIPKELFSQMGYLGAKGKWLAAYYVTGVFNMKCHDSYNKDSLTEQPLHLHVLETANSGMNLLKGIHKKEFENGNYKNQISLPYENEIREAYSEAKKTWEAQTSDAKECEQSCELSQGHPPESLGLFE